MPSHTLRQVTDVLAAALHQPAHERPEFVRVHCQDNPTLASEVLSFIDHYQQADSDGFLHSPAADADAMFEVRLIDTNETDSVDARSGTDVNELVQKIFESRISTASDISDWWGELAAEHRPASGQELLTSLVDRRKLTAYQAEVLAKDSGEPLVLGNYEILDHIAEGGMGRVFQARHRLMNRIVAIKLIARDAVDSPAAAKRFKREVEMAAKLNHPNIVQAFDADLADGTHLLVMEYVDGIDLGRMVRRTGPLPLAQAVDYILQAARGLAFAHQHRVVHRDVKPSNMLVDGDNTLKVLDMGLARLNAPIDPNFSVTRDELTQEDHFFGTLDYMAPEQATSAKTADHRADIYSLGCTLYYLLSAQPPYLAASPAAKIVAHRENPIPQLADLRDNVPAELDELFSQLLAKKPDQRVQSLDEVVHRLETLLPQLPDEEARTDWADLPEPLPLPKHSDAGSHSTATFDAVSTDSRRLQPLAEPTDSRTASPQPHQKSWWPQLTAVLLVLAAGAAIYQLLIRIPTSEGTLIVAFEDGVVPDNLVVQIDGERVSVETTDDGKAITIGVDPGKRRLRIETEGGTKFYANDELEIDRGGHSFLNVQLVLNVNDTGAAPSDDALSTGKDSENDLALAKWLLGFNADLHVRIIGGTKQKVSSKADLPTEPFHIIGVEISGEPDFSNDDMARLSRLQHVEHLYFLEIGVGDDCLVYIGEMETLTDLTLVMVNLTGKNLDAITNLDNLKHLTLIGNSIEPANLIALRELESLFGLHLQEAHLTDVDLEYLMGLNHLNILDLSGNPITGAKLKLLKDMARLFDVNLSHTRFNDAGAAILAENFPELTSLRIDNTRVTDLGLTSIGRLRKLEHLTISENPQLSDAGLEHLAPLNKLKSLDLSNNHFTDQGVIHLASLKGLTTLLLQDTDVADNSVATLAGLTNLTELDIRETAISSEKIEELRRALPGCDIRWSEANQPQAYNFSRDRELAQFVVTPDGGHARIELANDKSDRIDVGDPNQFPGEPFYLVWANLSHRDEMTDDSIARFRGLPKLEELHLAGTRIGDIGMTHVATMSNLRVLTLDGTYVTGLGLAQLASLSRLGSIKLANLNLRDEDLQAIPKSVSYLTLANTPVTRISQLTHIESLGWLDLSGLRIDHAEMKILLGHDVADELRSLFLRGAKVADETILAIAQQLDLTELSISNTQISDTALTQFWYQQDLQTLELGGCPNISDHGIESVAKLRSLQKLEIRDTHISDASIDHLAKHTQLQDLDIRRTRITQEGFQKLKQALPNCNIQWSAGPPGPSEEPSMVE